MSCFQRVTCVLSLCLLVACSPKGGRQDSSGYDYLNNEAPSDTYSTNSDAITAAPVTNTVATTFTPSDPSLLAVPNAATEKLIQEGFNVPLKGVHERQWHIFATSIDDSYINRYNQVHRALQSVFGGYPNWNYVVIDRAGPDAVNQAVFDRMIELKFNGYEGGYTTDELAAVAGCLTGSAPNGYNPAVLGRDYIFHSICIKNKTELEKGLEAAISWPEPPNYTEEQWQMDIGYADGEYHEYYHHMQRVHALDRIMNYPESDFDDSSRNVYAPFWWVEGAGQFAAWWLKSNWQKIDYLSYLEDENVWSQINEYESMDHYLDTIHSRLNKSFFFGASVMQNSANKIDGTHNLHVPLEEDCSDWNLSRDDSYYPDDQRRLSDPTPCSMLAFNAVYFLAYKSSWQVALRDILGDMYQYGFWGAVEKHTALTEQAFYDEFNSLMRSVDANTLTQDYAPDGWKIPSQAMECVVDFLNIDYYGKASKLALFPKEDTCPMAYQANQISVNIGAKRSTPGNVYIIDNTQNKPLKLAEGQTYTFNHSSAHPLRFSTTIDGIHNSGEAFNTGVSVSNGLTTLVVTEDTPKILYYYCELHPGMGASIRVE